MVERFRICVAVYLILIENKKILLQLRDGTNYMKGYYSVPSGHLEKLEGCIHALIRETKEETDLDIKREDIELKYLSNRLSDVDDVEYMCLFFTTKKYSGEMKIMEPHKCKELKFFDLDNLPENLVPELKDFLQNYLKEGKNYGEMGYNK